MIPQTTIVKPLNSNGDHQFEVTAGPSRSTTTIAVPIGVYHVIMDAQVPVGQINVRLRFFHDSQVIFPIAYTTTVGARTQIAKLVVDAPNSWIAIQGTATEQALSTARVGVTLIQIGET